MEYQFIRGIQRPNAARLSLALSSVLHDTPAADVQREIAKGSVYRESPNASSTLAVPGKTPHSVLSSGSVYSQDSWAGPEAWDSNKPPVLSSLATRGTPNVPSPLAYRQPRRPTPTATQQNSSSTGAHTPDSVKILPDSGRVSALTTLSNQNFTLSLGDMVDTSTGLEDHTKEKKTKLKAMYKRASRSAKRLTKIFRSPPPSGGIAKRSSLKTPLPIVTPPRELRSADPFASGSSVSSYGLSSLEVKRPTRKRAGSSPDVKPDLSVDIQCHLQRSPSVSSPLGIPTSPSLNKSTQQTGSQSIRGRDVPFPLNSDNVSLTLPRQRARSGSPSSMLSSGSQLGVTTSSRDQHPPPVPHIPSNISFEDQPRQRQPVLSSEVPPAQHMSPPQSSIASTGSIPHQRSRSRSVRETTRPPNVTHPPVSSRSRHDDPLSTNHRDDQVTIKHDKQSFLDVPIAQGQAQAIDGSGTGHGETRAFLGSAPETTVDFVKPRPRAASLRRDTSPASQELENPQKKSESTLLTVPNGLSERVPRDRTASTKSSRDPSPVPSLQPQSIRKPIVPQLSVRNLPPPDNPNVKQPSGSSLRSQPSIRSIPRSPSLPSLRPHFADAPPLPTPRANSHYEESRGRPQTSHARSPSLPSSAANPITSESLFHISSRQPLPSSIVERLRSRSWRPSMDSSSSSQPPSSVPATEKKPTSGSIPTHSYTQTHAHQSGSSTLSTASSPQMSTVPRHLKAKTRKSRSEGLKSPSMPDLRTTVKTTSAPSNRSQSRPSSPQPPRPDHPRSRPHPSNPSLTGPPVPPIPTSYKIPTNPDVIIKRRPESPPFTATHVLRPKANLTRPKELSYPPMKDRTFYARSNKELAKEGGWDFLDTPPRPPRTPSVMIPSTPAHQKLTFRLRSNSIKRGDVVPVTPVRKDISQKSIGMAL